MKLGVIAGTGLLLLVALLVLSAGQASGAVPVEKGQGPTTHYVSARMPVQGAGVELSAERPYVAPSIQPMKATSPYSNSWQLLATIPGAVVKDISFPSLTTGYAAAELGQVWKTTDAGAHWTRIVNVGYPYYWYGVHAFDDNTVVISGFINNNWHGVLRWSTDGGTTWTPDVVLTTQGWSYRVRFADADHGLVLDGVDMQDPNKAHYTTNGGRTAADWTPVVPDPSPEGGWFGNQFSLLPDLLARVSGITYCDSPNGGATWQCRSSIDQVFDGPTFFSDDLHGWVGGGSISPTVEGWVHATTDGGTTWTGRTLDSPWPIREIRFLDDQVGWAAGGNLYSGSMGAGGMYFSSDGGQTWAQDADTGAEMDACDSQPLPGGQAVWCAGYFGTGSYSSKIYGLLYATGSGTPTPTATPEPGTPTPTPETPVPTSTPVPPTPCPIQFTDVPPSDPYYPYIRCLVCRGFLGGYSDGTFRPYNNITRGQIAKIVSNTAGFQDDVTGRQTYTDVPSTNTFWLWIERLTIHGVMSGYQCGQDPNEPCDPQNRPYFRWQNNATRAQLAKIDSNAAGYSETPTGQAFTDVPTDHPFYLWVERLAERGIMGGYQCGGVGEPCDPQNRPYFRPYNNITRGQAAKIIANTFYPNCQTPSR